MKVISQQVEHKSDADGVIINIRSPAETTAAFEKISRDVKTPISGSVIDGIIVEQMLPGT
jgi:acetyltransferase